MSYKDPAKNGGKPRNLWMVSSPCLLWDTHHATHAVTRNIFYQQCSSMLSGNSGNTERHRYHVM